MSNPSDNSRIEVLRNNQLWMSWIGIYSHSPTNQNLKAFRTYVAYYMLFHMTTGISFSAIFVHDNPSDFQRVLEALLVIVAASQGYGCYVTVGSKLKEVKSLHFKIQEIVDKSQATEMYEFYRKTEDKCRIYTKYIVSYIAVHQSTFVTIMSRSLYSIFNGDTDTSNWLLPFHFVVPFDTTLVWGWNLLWFCQMSLSLCYITCMVTMTSYFVCCCFYLEALRYHFRYLIDTIQAMVKQNQTEPNPLKLKQNEQNISEKMHDVVEFHEKIFKIFKIMADINSGVIFCLLPVNAVFIAISMYNTEHSTAELSPQFILYDVLCIVSSLMWPYLFCDYATFATHGIASIENIVYDSNWYDYPPQLRKAIILIIAHSQQPFNFAGFNLIRCNLEIFGKIFKSSCSYYLLFRSFANI